MASFRRATAPGSTWFFTVATYRRQLVLTHPQALSALREAIIHVRTTRPFGIVAWVLLPDHMHAVWQLPEGDADYRDTLGVHQTPHCAGFKAPRACADRIFDESTQGDRVLEKALLEHQIHDDLDLARHVDYVHYNPVKHGLVERVADWPHSTFHRHVTRGLLPSEWAAASTGDAGFGEP